MANKTILPTEVNKKGELAGTGRTAMIVDIAEYTRLPDVKSKAAYAKAVYEYIDAQSDAPEDYRRELKTDIEKRFRNADEGKPSATQDDEIARNLPFSEEREDPAIAMSNTKHNVIVLDSDHKYMAVTIINLSSTRNDLLTPMTSDAHEQATSMYRREHELGHALYGADEASADYIAAIKTLREYQKHDPKHYAQAREALTLLADARLYGGMQYPLMANNYGYENYMAIRKALDMDPKELKNLTETQMMLNAQGLDRLQEKNRTMEMEKQPERIVMAAINAYKEEYRKLFPFDDPPKDKVDYKTMGDIARYMLNKQDFSLKSEESKILQYAADASDRLSKTGYVGGAVMQKILPREVNLAGELASTGRSALVVDVAEYRRLPDATAKADYMKAIYNYMNARQELSQDDRDKLKSEFAELFQNMDSGKPSGDIVDAPSTILPMISGVSSDVMSLKLAKQSIIIFDGDVKANARYAALINAQRFNITDAVIDDAHEKIGANFIRQRELASALYGSDYPGADFIAAVKILRDAQKTNSQHYAQARETLKLIADGELAGAIQDMDAAKDGGYEGYTAIHQALDMSPENLTRMSEAQMIVSAQALDSRLQNNNDMKEADRPVSKVRAAAEKYVDDYGKERPFGGSNKTIDYEALGGLARYIMEKSEFQSGSEEYKILQQTIEASDRLSKTGYGEKPIVLPSMKLKHLAQDEFGNAGEQYLAAIATFEVYGDDIIAAKRQLDSEKNPFMQKAAQDWSTLKQMDVAARSELAMGIAYDLDQKALEHTQQIAAAERGGVNIAVVTAAPMKLGVKV